MHEQAFRFGGARHLVGERRVLVLGGEIVVGRRVLGERLDVILGAVGVVVVHAHAVPVHGRPEARCR